MSNIVEYSSKSTAVRGLTRHLGKAAEGVDLNALIFQQGGKWAFDKDAADKAAGLADVSEEDENLILFCGHSNCPSCGIHLSNGVTDFEGMVDARGSEKAAYAVMKHEFACLGCNHEWGKEVEAPKGSKRGEPTRHYVNKSTVDGAVALCHDLFSKNPDARRKDAIQLAVDAGVAFYTARTQYQKWFKAQKTSRVK